MFESRIRRRGVGVAVCILLLFAACGGDDGTDGNGGGQAEASEITQLTPSPIALSSYWPPIIAEEFGYFEEENLEVETNAADAGSGQVTQQVTAGQVPAGWATGTAIVAAYAKAPDLRVVVCHQLQNQFRVMTLEESPIQSLEDLEGQTLGVTDVAGGEIILVEAVLSDVGLERDEDVEVLPIGAGSAATITAVQSDRVQAYAADLASLSAMKSEGLVFRDLTPPEFQDIPASCLFTTTDVLEDEQGREDFIGLARAWVKGNVFTVANPDAAFEIICENRPEECRDRDAARALFEDNLGLIPSLDPDVPLGSFTDEGWERLAQMLKDAGTIEEDVDVTDLIHGEEIDAVREAALDFDHEEVEQDAESAQ